MIKSFLFITAILAFVALPLSAKDLHYPKKGDASFTITIPDDWEPEKDEDGTLEASSPKENVSLTIWTIESDKEANDLGKDIVDLLKDHAKDIKIDGDIVEAHPGGMDGALLKGMAKDKEDGKDIGFFALIISDKKKASVVFIEVNADASKDEQSKLEGILKSIKKA